ncbi:MAG: hypothetical protein PHQ59_03690 [Candidatus Daviesbacteria bacterium]|nr:hypothetical protein [Candidatus Daviesbacteria bacterium]
MENREIQSLNNQTIYDLESTNAPNDSPLTQQNTYEKLNEIFIEQDKQKRTILEAREILGETAESLTDSQVFDLVNEIQFLVDSWIEEYEQKVFSGKTLNELLNLNP